MMIFFSIFIFLKMYFDNVDEKKNNISKISNIDITLPKFSIKNNNQKISITAKEGYFIGKNRILLNKDVLFKSDNFIIKSDNVIFDRKKFTAETTKKTIFESKKAKIYSDGFNISENGNKIDFTGKSQVILR